jgi:hypothetical protein
MPKTKKTFVFAEERKRYERQPKEPDRAWFAFVIYRDMGLDRTLAKTAEIYRERYGVQGKPESTERQMQGWSPRWHWRDRVEAWDMELDRLKRKKEIVAVQEMHQRHLALAKGLQTLGSLGLQSLIERAKAAQTTKDPVELTSKEVNSLVEIGIKLERGSRGEPETVVEERRKITSNDRRQALRALVEDEESMDVISVLVEKARGSK